MNKKSSLLITLLHSTAKSWAESPGSASGFEMDFNSAYNNYYGLIDWKNLKLATVNDFGTDEDYRQEYVTASIG